MRQADVFFFHVLCFFSIFLTGENVFNNLTSFGETCEITNPRLKS